MDPQVITLELVRVEDAGDPSAFRRGVQEYLLRDEGGTYAPATLRWDDALLSLLGRVRERDPGASAEIGAVLRRFVAGARLAGAEDAILRALAERRSVRLEIAASAAELLQLPWELLALTDGRHVGELPGVEVVYRWPGVSPVADARPPRREGGRVLFAWSRSHGNVAEQHHLRALIAAAAAAGFAFDPARDVLADASLAGLGAALAAAGDAPFTLLHILCHGAPLGEGFGLGLDDGRGGREAVDGGALRRVLQPFAGHLRAVIVSACDSGNAGAPGGRLGSVAQELHRGGFAAVVAARHPVSGGAALSFTEHVYEALLSGACSIGHAFHAARARLARAGSPEWAAFQLYSHGEPAHPVTLRPYRGLLAFERAHAGLFFGRDAETAECLGDLDALLAAERPRLLAVAGASGTGKSSLVLCAVRVALEARGAEVLVMRPGRDPAQAFAAALRGAVVAAPPLRVLIVDQFEEVFTLAAPADAVAFARDLWARASRPGDRFAVILTLRVDFVGRCGELALDETGARLDRVVYDEAHRVFVPQMGPAALYAAITGPAARAGLRVEPGLAERLLREVSGESNALPLLSYVLDELWLRRQADALTHAALDAAGGVATALARHADAVVDAVDARARAHIRRVFVRLVRFGSDPASGVRQREDLDALRSRSDPEGWDRAVAALVAARLLLRREGEDRRVTLEVAHEAIIRHWQRLWGWYTEDRERLARVAELARLVEQWRKFGPLRGKALAFGQELAAGLGDDDVTDEARSMLAESAARARRSLWLRRGLVAAALVTLTIFSVVAAVLGLVARTSAERAELAAGRARAATRVAAAERFLGERPHLAAALLRGVAPEDALGWSAAAFRALQAILPEVTAPAAPLLTAITYAPDGALIAVDREGGLRVIPSRGPLGPRVADPEAASAAPRELHDPGAKVALAAAGDLVFVARDKRLEAWRREGLGLTRRAVAALDVQYGVTLVAGGLTPRVVVGSETTWELVGDRLEARYTHPTHCLRVDGRSELALCRSAGGVTMDVVSWSGEVVARGDEAAIPPHDVEDHVEWAWQGDRSAPTPRILRAADQRGAAIVDVSAFPDRTLFWAHRGAFGVDGTEACTQSVGDEARPRCVPVAPGCTAAPVVGRELPVVCPGRIGLHRVEDLGLAQELRGFDAAPRSFVADAEGREAAALDRDGRLWRWPLRARRSGRTTVGDGWQTIAPLGYMRIPHLQAERGRIAAVLWDSSVRVVGWPLDARDLPAIPEPIELALPIAADVQHAPLYALAGDTALVTLPGERGGPGSIVVATFRDGRIDHRTLAAPDVADLYPVAVSRDGAWGLFLRGETYVRADLRGAARVDAHALASPEGTLWAVDPNVRRALRQTGSGRAEIVDLTTGAARALPSGSARVNAAAWSRDGGRLALGLADGEVKLLQVEDDALLPQRTLRHHRDALRTLTFAGGDAQLVSADEAGQIVLWQELGRDDPPRLAVVGPGDLMYVGASPDRRQLWGLTPVGALYTWALVDDPAAAARELRERSTYCLSADEWTRYVGVAAEEAAALASGACAAAGQGAESAGAP